MELHGLAGRGAALAAAGCVVVHALLLATARTGVEVVLTFAMLVLSLLCCTCAPALWRAPAAGTWRTVRGLAGAALALHLLAVVVAGTAGTAGDGAVRLLSGLGHGGHGSGSVVLVVGPGLVLPAAAAVMWAALLLAVAQVVVASLALRPQPVAGGTLSARPG